MPAPIYVNVDSSYKPKRNMIKKYAASAARVQKQQSPNLTGNSFYTSGKEVIKTRPMYQQKNVDTPMSNPTGESERGQGISYGAKKQSVSKTDQTVARQEPVSDIIPQRDSDDN